MITNKFQKNWLSLLINTLFEDFYGWCYKTGNSEGGSRKIPGGGEAPVGRRVRKTIGNRGVAEGHVSSRVYETECDKQKEEAIEWLDPESYLVHQNKTTSAPIEEGKVIKPLRKSLRNAQKVKKVEEFVYTRRTVRRRRRKK